MFTDMVGYTALGQRNESLSLALVKEQRKLVRPILKRHEGKEVDTIGDAFLVVFSSALDATRCAYDIQRATREFNFSLPEDRRIRLRIGIHLGDVVESGSDISGDAVNVASRIEPLAEEGGVCLTRQVFDHVQNKFEVPMVSIGSRNLKNVNMPTEVYKMVMPWKEVVAIEPAQLDKRRIAVLPFANMSPDPNDGYFADGLTEELISTISNISELSVISRTSAMKFKGGGKTIAEIGGELKAGTILEGSVRKADNSIRVTAQLIDANTDRHLWSKNYDSELKNVFSLQGEIAKQVASALQVSILSTEMKQINKEQTSNPSAYTLYLKGRYLWNRRGVDDIKKAIEYFGQAVKEDPNFALGYAGLADCYHLLDVNWQINVGANRSKADSMVTRALELDPNLAEAHTTKADILFRDCRLKEATEEFKKAIELKPSYATAHQWYHYIPLVQLEWDEALMHIEKAVELDPLSPMINSNLAGFYYWKRDYAKASELGEKAIDLNPESSEFHFNQAASYAFLKKFDEMKRELDIGIRLIQEVYPRIHLQAEIWLAYLENDREKVAALLPEMEANMQESGWDEYGSAAYHFYLGEFGKGFEWLERAYEKRLKIITFVGLDYKLDGIRDDPRYFSLLDRLGLASLKDRNPWRVSNQ
jgi:adenylate cyclase